MLNFIHNLLFLVFGWETRLDRRLKELAHASESERCRDSGR